MSKKMLSVTPNVMVKNVNATIDYYKENFNFQTIMTVPDSGHFNWAMLQRDGVTIMLQKQESLIEEYPVLKGRTLGGSLSLFIKVENIKDLYEGLKRKASICFLKDLHQTTYGMQEFAVEDLNGYVLTFAQN